MTIFYIIHVTIGFRAVITLDCLSERFWRTTWLWQEIIFITILTYHVTRLWRGPSAISSTVRIRSVRYISMYVQLVYRTSLTLATLKVSVCNWLLRMCCDELHRFREDHRWVGYELTIMIFKVIFSCWIFTQLAWICIVSANSYDCFALIFPACMYT